MKMFLCVICLFLLALKATTDLAISLWLCFAPLLLILAWTILRIVAGWAFILGLIFFLAASVKEHDRRSHPPFHIPDKDK